MLLKELSEGWGDGPTDPKIAAKRDAYIKKRDAGDALYGKFKNALIDFYDEKKDEYLEDYGNMGANGLYTRASFKQMQKAIARDFAEEHKDNSGEPLAKGFVAWGADMLDTYDSDAHH